MWLIWVYVFDETNKITSCISYVCSLFHLDTGVFDKCEKYIKAYQSICIAFIKEQTQSRSWGGPPRKGWVLAISHTTLTGEESPSIYVFALKFWHDIYPNIANLLPEIYADFINNSMHLNHVVFLVFLLFFKWQFYIILIIDFSHKSKTI